MKHRLTHGESLILVPGGAAEALHAHGGVMKLYLKNRKGFVKLAMETNAKLVPVIGFGENDIFDTLYPYSKSSSTTTTTTITTTTNSGNGRTASFSSTASSSSGQFQTNLKHTIWHLQQQFLKVMSFSLPILTNLIPKRTPLNVVVGGPVQFTNPEDVNQCHEEYIMALNKLYDTHKSEYGYDHVELEII